MDRAAPTRSDDDDRLGRLDRDSRTARERRHGERLELRRRQTQEDRAARSTRLRAMAKPGHRDPFSLLADSLAGRAQSFAQTIERYLVAMGEGARVPQVDRADAAKAGAAKSNAPASPLPHHRSDKER